MVHNNKGTIMHVIFFNLDLFFKIVPNRNTSKIITKINASYRIRTEKPRANPQKIRLKNF